MKKNETIGDRLMLRGLRRPGEKSLPCDRIPHLANFFLTSVFKKRRAK